MTTSGYINDTPIGWIEKKVQPYVRLVKTETPGRYGSSLDSFKEGGIDITLDIIANSVTERNSIVEAFMQDGRSKLGLGGVDTGWYYSGKCADRSTDLAIADWVPAETYPLSFLFTTDEPFMFSETQRTFAKDVDSNLQILALGTQYVGNMGQNFTFDKWSSATGDITTTVGTVITSNIGTTTQGAVFSADGTKLYVANYSAGNIAVVTVATGAVATFNTSISSPWDIAISPDGTKIYVSNSGNATVTVYNTSNNSLAATVNVGTTPKGICISQDGSRVFVANSGSNTCSVILTSNNSVAATVNTGSTPTTVSVKPDMSEAWVGNSGASTTTVFNPTTYSVITTWPTPAAPTDIAFTPDTSKIYVLTGSKLQVTDLSATTTYNLSYSSAVSMCMSPSGARLYIFYAQSSTYRLQVWDCINDVVLDTVTLAYAPVQAAINVLGDTLYFTTASTRIYPVSTYKLAPDNVYPATSSAGFARALYLDSGTALSALMLAPKQGYVMDVYETFIFEPSSEYTIGINARVLNRVSGVANLTLVVEGVTLETDTTTSTSFEWLTLTHTFAAMTKGEVHFSVTGSPGLMEQAQFRQLCVVKSENYSNSNPASAITCAGTVNSMPDIIATGALVGTGSINQSGSTTPAVISTVVNYTSSTTSYGTAVHTVTLTPPSGVAYLLTGVGLSLKSSASAYMVFGKITITSTGLYGSVETTVMEWATNNTTATDFSLSSLKIQAAANTNIVLKWYIRSTSTSATATLSKISYGSSGGVSAGGSSTTLVSVFPTNLKLTNSSDETMRTEIANVLFPGQTVRINSDGSGYMVYQDDFKTNIYSLIATSSQTGVTYSAANQDVTIANGYSLTYPIDLKYPIAGVPVLYLLVEQGVPIVGMTNYAGLDTLTYVPDYLYSPAANTWQKYYLINSQNCNLAGSTRFDLSISCTSATSVKIKGIFLLCSLITIDAEIPTIVPDVANLYRVFMDNSATCNIGLVCRDRIWGI